MCLKYFINTLKKFFNWNIIKIRKLVIILALKNYNLDLFDSVIIPVVGDNPICHDVFKTFVLDFLNKNDLLNNDEVYTLSFSYKEKIKNICLINIKDNDFSNLKKLYKKAINNFLCYKSKKVFVYLPKQNQKELILFCLDSLYVFDKYKNKKEEIFDIDFSYDISLEEFKEIKILHESKNFCKDLVNEPANFLTPKKFCEIVKEKCSSIENLKLEIYKKKDIEKFSMHSFLEVAKGSNNEPYFLKLEYCTDKRLKKTAFVGKGITYDSGGFSLKPSDCMFTMKSDMAGAASVVSSMISIAKNKLPANLVCVTLLCENILSSKAYKPGDVINSLSKKTIEVDNTDAEGRLTLADAITFCDKNENADEIITVATLTGSAIRTLSHFYTPVITNNDDFYERLKLASKNSCEKIWQLPFDEIYAEGFKSNIADFKNTAGINAGCISAGMFLSKFCDKDFLHLDIAGTSWYDKANFEFGYGATGTSVYLLYQYIKNMGDKNFD